MSATTTTFVFKDPAVVETMSIIHYKYVVFPADNATNNIFIICKKHYIDCYMIYLGLDNCTYSVTANCLFVYCLLHLCIRMFIGFLCNINHCNDSAPCWDLDWSITYYLILSMQLLSYQ